MSKLITKILVIVLTANMAMSPALCFADEPDEIVLLNNRSMKCKIIEITEQYVRFKPYGFFTHKDEETVLLSEVKKVIKNGIEVYPIRESEREIEKVFVNNTIRFKEYPYLPAIGLSIISLSISVMKFQKYADLHEAQSEAQKANLSNKDIGRDMNKNMLLGVGFLTFGAASLFLALKPKVIEIPIEGASVALRGNFVNITYEF
jgi:hypothetical protein